MIDLHMIGVGMIEQQKWFPSNLQELSLNRTKSKHWASAVLTQKTNQSLGSYNHVMVYCWSAAPEKIRSAAYML